MSNPDSSTPSRAALDKAVKPARMTWGEFIASTSNASATRQIAFAYAELLDKADKVGRFHVSGGHECREGIDALAQALILPDPIDPDLLEAAKDAHVQLFGSYMPDQDSSNINILMNLARRGRELAKEQDRG